MTQYTIRPLDADSWPAYAALLDKHNGAGFGCYCTWFHPRRKDRGIDTEVEGGRPYKEWLVCRGEAHAAVVFGGDVALAWAQYGTPAELPGIHHRKDYDATQQTPPPDYRITCIFVDRNHRRSGLAGVALRGALELIARSGGGVVEGYPQDTGGKKISASFLYNTTRTTYEKEGFAYDHKKGKNHCVMRRVVEAA